MLCSTLLFSLTHSIAHRQQTSTSAELWVSAPLRRLKRDMGFGFGQPPVQQCTTRVCAPMRKARRNMFFGPFKKNGAQRGFRQLCGELSVAWLSAFMRRTERNMISATMWKTMLNISFEPSAASKAQHGFRPLCGGNGAKWFSPLCEKQGATC